MGSHSSLCFDSHWLKGQFRENLVFRWVVIVTWAFVVISGNSDKPEKLKYLGGRGSRIWWLLGCQRLRKTESRMALRCLYWLKWYICKLYLHFSVCKWQTNNKPKGELCGYLEYATLHETLFIELWRKQQ